MRDITALRIPGHCDLLAINLKSGAKLIRKENAAVTRVGSGGIPKSKRGPTCGHWPERSLSFHLVNKSQPCDSRVIRLIFPRPCHPRGYGMRELSFGNDSDPLTRNQEQLGSDTDARQRDINGSGGGIRFEVFGTQDQTHRDCGRFALPLSLVRCGLCFHHQSTFLRSRVR